MKQVQEPPYYLQWRDMRPFLGWNDYCERTDAFINAHPYYIPLVRAGLCTYNVVLGFALFEAPVLAAMNLERLVQ